MLFLIYIFSNYNDIAFLNQNKSHEYLNNSSFNYQKINQTRLKMVFKLMNIFIIHVVILIFLRITNYDCNYEERYILETVETMKKSFYNDFIINITMVLLTIYFSPMIYII